MNEQLLSYVERLVISFERIARALEGLDDTYRRKEFPERKETREAVVTRIPTEEDRIREAQGASGQPLDDWLNELSNEEEDIGTREREWIERQNQQKRDAGSTRPA